MTTVLDCLDAMSAAMERAREALEEGEDLIIARQKVIRIADCSEYGWATVEDYKEDELAANSDDEKRLYRTEMQAGMKSRAAASKGKKKREFFLEKTGGPGLSCSSAQLLVTVAVSA